MVQRHQQGHNDIRLKALRVVYSLVWLISEITPRPRAGASVSIDTTPARAKTSASDRLLVIDLPDPTLPRVGRADIANLHGELAGSLRLRLGAFRVLFTLGSDPCVFSLFVPEAKLTVERPKHPSTATNQRTPVIR